MAKTNMIERDKRRAKIVKKYAGRRATLKELIRSPKTAHEDRIAARRSCRRCRGMRVRRVSAIVVRSPAARAACIASLVWPREDP